MNFISHFSGCGGAATGAKISGFNLVGAVEIDEKIAQLYRDNLSAKIIVDDVSKVNPPKRPEGLLVIQTSPPCQDYSIANHNRTESNNILNTTHNWYSELKPDYVILENVVAYQYSKPYQKFKSFLKSLGYLISEVVVNSANYGVPQTRKRFFMLGTLPPNKPIYFTPTHTKYGAGLFGLPQWISWSKVIDFKSLEPTTLTDYQIQTVGRFGEGILDRCWEDIRVSKIRNQHQPVFTLTTKTSLKVVKNGNVRKLNSQNLAKLQGFPDWYQWYCSYELSKKAIGNSVPPILISNLLKSIL